MDPALYSRMLMASGKYCADSIHPSYRDPVRIMSDAYEHSTEIQGSSTCCVVLLDGYCLKTANLGDSGFMVIRGSEIVFRTKEQQHSFNFPYQLGTGSADFPSHAVSVTVNIQPGDLVIIGTVSITPSLINLFCSMVGMLTFYRMVCGTTCTTTRLWILPCKQASP